MEGSLPPSKEIITLKGYVVHFHGDNEYEILLDDGDERAMLQTMETHFESKGYFELYAVKTEKRKVTLTEEAGGFEATIQTYKEIPKNHAENYNKNKDALIELQDCLAKVRNNKNQADIAIVKLLKSTDKNKSFLGGWVEDGDGRVLNISDIGEHFIAGEIVNASATTGRSANVNFCGLLFDNQLDFQVDNDGWYNKGVGLLKLHGDEVIVALEIVNNKNANWSIGSGEFIFHKNQVGQQDATNVQEIEIIYAVETGDEGLEPQQVDRQIPGGYYFQWDRITASSTLSPEKGNAYSPSHAVDVNNSTAWVEGAPDAGIGEWIYFENNVPKEISCIQINNGYLKSEDLFWANNRLKKIRFDFSDGQSAIAMLADGYQKGNTIFLDRKISTNYLKTTILDVYKGDRHNDTCVSEIWVF